MHFLLDESKVSQIIASYEETGNLPRDGPAARRIGFHRAQVEDLEKARFYLDREIAA